jgi:hypothetical protein
LVRHAARALASRGEAGYEALLSRLPADDKARNYMLMGVVPISRRDPDRARNLAYRACEAASGPALGSIRWMDEHLYLNEGRERASRPSQTRSR